MSFRNCSTDERSPQILQPLPLLKGKRQTPEEAQAESRRQAAVAAGSNPVAPARRPTCLDQVGFFFWDIANRARAWYNMAEG